MRRVDEAAGIRPRCSPPPRAATRGASARTASSSSFSSTRPCVIQPFRHRQAQSARHQRFGQDDIQVVLVVAALLPSASTSRKPSVVIRAVRAPLRSIMRVGGERGAVDHDGDVRGGQARAPQDGRDAVHHAFFGRGGRGEHLGGDAPPACSSARSVKVPPMSTASRVGVVMRTSVRARKTSFPETSGGQAQFKSASFARRKSKARSGRGTLFRPLQREYVHGMLLSAHGSGPSARAELPEGGGRTVEPRRGASTRQPAEGLGMARARGTVVTRERGRAPATSGRLRKRDAREPPRGGRSPQEPQNTPKRITRPSCTK